MVDEPLQDTYLVVESQPAVHLSEPPSRLHLVEPEPSSDAAAGDAAKSIIAVAQAPTKTVPATMNKRQKK